MRCTVSRFLHDGILLLSKRKFFFHCLLYFDSRQFKKYYDRVAWPCNSYSLEGQFYSLKLVFVQVLTMFLILVVLTRWNLLSLAQGLEI